MLLNEFDGADEAVLSPERLVAQVPGMPKVVVSCFDRKRMEGLAERLNAVEIAAACNANQRFPVCRAQVGEKAVGLVLAAVGASTCVGEMEEIFAMGAEKLVVFGTCGVLDAAIADCSIIVPTSALRDEGTSFHYAPAGEEIAVNVGRAEELLALGQSHGLRCHTGKTWTTDAFYREGRAKMARRKAAGCVAVDMECSALAALAAFRQKEIVQFFYAADNLDAEAWEPRSLTSAAKLPEKERAAALALEMALCMA